MTSSGSGSQPNMEGEGGTIMAPGKDYRDSIAIREKRGW